MPRPELSVIILSFNTLDLLRECLTALRCAADGHAIEIIVVDNGSTDGSLAFLQAQPNDVRLIVNETNVGFAAANNQGMAAARAELLLLLNSDAFITAEALREGMRILAEQPKAGLVGLRLLNPDGSLQAEYGRFPTLWSDMMTSIGLDQLDRRELPVLREPMPVDWVQGACMFVRRTALEAVGGLDTSFFMYSEEVDWCRRFQQRDWQVWYLPQVAIVHVGGGSARGNDLGRRTALYHSRLLLRRRMDGRLAGATLWAAMLFGLAARVVVRTSLQAVLRRSVRGHSPRSDWQLLRRLARGAHL